MLIYGLIPLLVVLIPWVYSSYVWHRANTAEPARSGTYRSAVVCYAFLGLTVVASTGCLWLFYRIASLARPWDAVDYLVIAAPVLVWFALLGLAFLELRAIRLEVTDHNILVSGLFRSNSIERRMITTVAIIGFTLFARGSHTVLKIPIVIENLPRIIARLRIDAALNSGGQPPDETTS